MDKTKLLSLLNKTNLIRAIYAVVILLLAISAVWGWFRKPEVQYIHDQVFVPAPALPAVVKVKTVYVDVGKVQVLDKAEAIKKLDGFPENVAKDPDKEITSTARIAPHKASTSVINVISKKTGVSEIYAKREKIPFMAIEQERYAGIRIGSTGQVTGFVEWGFARVGKLHAGAYGQYGTRDGAEIGVIGKIEF